MEKIIPSESQYLIVICLIMNNKFFLLLLISQIGLIALSNAQNMGIGTNATPNVSAMLDITSSTKGLLIPQVTTLPTAGATGLLVYNSNALNINLSAVNATPNWSSAWGTAGNSITNSGKYFLGTTNSSDLRFRTNNIERMVIDSTTGYVGIGLPNISSTQGSIPNSTLQVNGSLAKSIDVVSSGVLPTTSYSTILFTNGTGNNTQAFTLPLGVSGIIYTIKFTGKKDVVISSTSPQKIDGQTSYTITTTNYTITLQSDGNNWYIIGIGTL